MRKLHKSSIIYSIKSFTNDYLSESTLRIDPLLSKEIKERYEMIVLTFKDDYNVQVPKQFQQISNDLPELSSYNRLYNFWLINSILTPFTASLTIWMMLNYSGFFILKVVLAILFSVQLIMAVYCYLKLVKLEAAFQKDLLRIKEIFLKTLSGR